MSQFFKHEVSFKASSCDQSGQMSAVSSVNRLQSLSRRYATDKSDS